MKDADDCGSGGGDASDARDDDGGEARMDVDEGAPASASADGAAVDPGHHAFIVMTFRDTSLVSDNI